MYYVSSAEGGGGGSKYVSRGVSPRVQNEVNGGFTVYKLNNLYLDHVLVVPSV